ncbi:hypothetical protein CW362_23940 [Streptomyces populi]|uniref:Uncharacterized protein n=1 Tax=Streptomyces populi TaxID=2058924 RepID=A0A2I0SKT4_9ACTN|nr:hypothetical protein [Streptomyces populi]PKT70521.1 hypothetical protein CW362_23940 [Streptomyces populi]
MSTASGASRDDHPVRAPGALLLCRARPESAGPAARLLRERMLIAGAGPGWSVLVPEGRPWRHGAEPVDRVLTGWAAALAVGAPWPVLALWWDTDRSGFTLASGFHRTVGYEWLADGTPVGEHEAMHTFATRLGLDPVLDVQSLEPLTRPDPVADARVRVSGLLAVLTRAGVLLPAGVEPGEPADRLRDAVRIRPDAEQIEWNGWRAAVGAELDVVESGGLGPWLRGPRARTLAAAQLAVGLPVAVWGIRRHSGGWIAAGTVLTLRGALGLAYDQLRAYD